MEFNQAAQWRFTMLNKTGVSVAALTVAFAVTGAMAQSTTPHQRGLTSVPSTTAE